MSFAPPVIGGLPVTVWLGLATITLFAVAFVLGLGLRKNWFAIHPRWHYALAGVAMLMAVVHGGTVAAVYLG